MRRLIAPLLLTAACLARSAAADVSTELDGQFSVGDNGDARYTLELPLPPGIGSTEPQLSLTYSSQRGDDRLGLGWRLQGLSAITRCSAIPATDGFRGTVAYNANDRYCLDGQRLINVQGTYGSADSVYRTELETWRLVTASSTLCGSGPCSFTVIGRGGDTATYGTTSDSRILAVGKPDVRVWALDATADMNGNTVRYRYTLTPTTGVTAAFGQFYASEIAYTTNAKAGVTSANRFVRFAYTPRTLPISAFVGGSRVYSGALLAKVQTYVGETLASEWRLNYTQPTLQQPTLTTAQECAGADASSPCLSPTTVTSQDPGKVSFTGSTLAPTLAPFETIVPLEITGDGKGDLAYATGTSSQITITSLISDGTAMTACAKSLVIGRPSGCKLDGSGTSRCALLPAEVNGDGRGDLVFAFKSGSSLGYAIYTAEENGCSFASGPSATLAVPAAYNDLWPMDVNGDGITDLVGGWTATSKETIVTFLGDGGGFTQAGSFDLTVAPNQRIWPAEVNGDGMLDLTQVFWNSGSAIELATYLSTGTNFQVGPASNIPSGSSNLTGLWPLDVNGDGKADLVQGWDKSGGLQLSTFLASGAGGFVCESPDASGTFQQGCTTNTQKGLSNVKAFWPMDADGDNRIDLVQAWQQGGSLNLIVYTNAATGLSQGEAAGASLAGTDAASVFPLDYTGDGKTDLVQAYLAGGKVSILGYRSNGPIPGLAAEIVNNLGGRFKPTYKPMSDASVYAQGTPSAPGAVALAYPYRQAPAQGPYQQVGGGHLQLVAEVVRANDPASNSSSYSYRDLYSYEGALVDLASGRGWAGFRRLNKLEFDTGQRMVATYNQKWPVTGTTAQIEYQCDATVSPDPLCPEGATATVLSDSDTSYIVATTATGATSPFPSVVQVLKDRVLLTTYDYGAYDFSRAKSYQYDAYGNQTLLADWGYVDRQGNNPSTSDDVFTCSRFDNTVSGNSWQLGYLADRKVSAVAACNDFSSFNDATDFSLDHLTYTAEKNLATQAAYDNVNRVFLKTTYGYDLFGNQISKTLPGNRTTTFTFEPTYNTYVSCTVTPPNEDGQHLAVAMGFDPRFGTQVAYTESLLTPGTTCPPVSGTPISTLCLDAFGRGIASQGPVPAQPAGVVSDTNCVSTLVTGDAAAFRSAKVVTLAATSHTSDAKKRRVSETKSLQTWTIGQGTAVTRFQRSFVDGLGRQYLTATQQSTSGSLTASCVNFDADDKTLRTSVPRIFASDDVDCTSSSGSSSLLWTTSRYDVYGRLTQQVQPMGPDGSQTNVSTMAYEKDVEVTLTQAAGQPEQLVKVLDYEYFNSQRQLVRLTLPGDGNATTTLGYDRIGRQTSMIDPATPTSPQGVPNTITYDSLDRRLTADNPDQNSCLLSSGPGCSASVKALALSYSPVTGFLATTTDALGEVTSFSYDQLGRMTKKVLAGSGAGAGMVLYHFDDPAVVNSAGELTALEESNSSGTLLYRYTYGYDVYGQNTSTTLALDGATYVSSQVNDPLGRPTTLTDPDGFAITRTYEMGNLARLASGATAYAEYADFTATGQPQRASYGNGAAATYAYTPTGQPLSQQVFDSRSAKLLDLVVGTNHLLQVTSSTDLLRAGGTDLSQTFTYRSTRLATASAPGLYGDLSFGYDAAGNLTAKDGLTLSYQAHRVVAASGPGVALDLAYDRNGNLERRTAGSNVRTFTYDVRNRLTRVANAEGALLDVPLYNDHGSRLKKHTPDGVETIYVSSRYELTRFPGGASEVTRLINDDAGTVATVTVSRGADPPEVPGVPTPGTLYFHRDILGSTSLTTGEDGLLASRVAYVPYGGVFEPGSSGPNNFRPKFQGQELDQSAELYYFGARFYDPTLGRFTSADTQLADDFTTPDVLNRYAFALNDPTTLIDPTGHNVWEAIGGVLIGVAEITLGVAVDVLSDGALEPLGGALIGAGMNGIQYSATHSSNFSWKQFGIEEGTGAAFGALTGGFGGEAEAGISTVATEASEEVGASVARTEAEELTAQAGGEALETSTERNVADELGETASGRESVADGEAPRGEGQGEESECGCSCRASFPAGVSVWLEDGRLPIDAFVGRERVLSRSSLDFATRPQAVTLTLQRLVDELAVLELTTNGGRSERLEITVNHPLWVEGRGWVPAGELSVGDVVATLDDRARITSTLPLVRAPGTRVFNIEVEGLHSYFVGELGVWVHNPGGCYTLRDEDGNVVRTGRTKDLARREAEHARGAETRDYTFHVEYETDDYAEQRGLEHELYEQYPDAQAENGGLNKAKAIRDNNPRKEGYLAAAARFLAGLFGGN